MSRSTPSSTPRHAVKTFCVHCGHQPDRSTRSRAVPIHQTTSYVFTDTEEAALRFDLDRALEAA